MPPKDKKKPLTGMAAVQAKKAENAPKALVKKVPPPPACFTLDDILRFKQLFKQYELADDKVKTTSIPLMLRILGFNPKGAEVEELFARFLEDEFVDTVELWEWYKMIEIKKNWGDDVENVVFKAIEFLAHEDPMKPTGIVKLEDLKTELMIWGEPLTEAEFVDLPIVASKEKTYTFETDELQYLKFVERLNLKDVRFLPEPINFFKQDPKVLAAMAREKMEAEKEEKRKRTQERREREMAKRQRLIEQGLLQPSEAAAMAAIPDYVPPPDPFYLLSNYL